MDAPTDVLLQHWPGVLFRQATDLRFEFLSPRIADWTGHPPEAFRARPELFFECVPRWDADALRAHLDLAPSPEGRFTRFRFLHSTTGRSTHVSQFRRAVLDSSGAVKNWEGFWNDETRLALAERRLESAAWHEILSELTGGYAHDFNNVFGAVHSLSDTFLSQIAPGDPFYDGLALMKRTTHQAGKLVRRLQQLHSSGAGQRAYHDLNTLVTDSAELIRRGLSKRVEIVPELAPGQLPILADAVGLQHVIVALVLNAAEAMSGGGKVVLRTRATGGSRTPDNFVVGTWPKTPAARLSVEDFGLGLAPRQLAALFEAGFTTRPGSLGIGLGFLHARRFAERHRGAVSVESTPGGGTSVHLWLPQADFKEADAASSSSATPGGTILLAGQPVSGLAETAKVLGQHNFRVILADETTPELLASPDHDVGALLVLATPTDSTTERLIEFIRRHRLPVKVFVQPSGCTADSLDAGLLAKADATFAEDIAEERLVEKVTKAMSGW